VKKKGQRFRLRCEDGKCSIYDLWGEKFDSVNGRENGALVDGERRKSESITQNDMSEGLWRGSLHTTMGAYSTRTQYYIVDCSSKTPGQREGS